MVPGAPENSTRSPLRRHVRQMEHHIQEIVVAGDALGIALRVVAHAGRDGDAAVGADRRLRAHRAAPQIERCGAVLVHLDHRQTLMGAARFTIEHQLGAEREFARRRRSPASGQPAQATGRTGRRHVSAALSDPSETRIPGATQHIVVRCRTGTVSLSQFLAIPDRRCSHCGCAVSGILVRHHAFGNCAISGKNR